MAATAWTHTNGATPAGSTGASDDRKSPSFREGYLRSNQRGELWQSVAVAEDGGFMTRAQFAFQSSGERPSSDTLAIIPTYNERENLPASVARIHRAHADVHILIVDDGSPDDTAKM